jgi:hypothetical protein
MDCKEIEFHLLALAMMDYKEIDCYLSLGVSHGGLPTNRLDGLPTNQFSLGWIAKRSSFISWRYSWWIAKKSSSSLGVSNDGLQRDRLHRLELAMVDCKEIEFHLLALVMVDCKKIEFHLLALSMMDCQQINLIDCQKINFHLDGLQRDRVTSLGVIHDGLQRDRLLPIAWR